MARLTDLTLRNLAPRGVQYCVADEALPNFGVRVGSRGGISFYVMYRVYGRRRRDTLGRFPILSLHEARSLARQRLAKLILNMRGPDIGSAMTFAEAAKSFVESHCFVQNRPGTAVETQRLLLRHWLPAFGRRLLDDVGTREVASIVERLRRDTPSEAQHAFSALRKFYNWSRQQRLVGGSPCDHLSLGFRPTSRTRVLNNAELIAVYRASLEVGHPYGCIVRLLMLTGQRRNEIARLSRSFINAQDRLITLPSWLVKNGREHTFGYGELTAHALASVADEGDLLFPARGHDDRPYCGWSKAKLALDLQTGINFTLHDLRRTWASHVAELGVPPWVIEAHLNHVSGTVSGVAAIYNRHRYLGEACAAVHQFESKIEALLK